MVITTALTTIAGASFAYGALKFSVIGTIASLATASWITVPLGIVGFLSAIATITYGAWMITQITNAINYTNKYKKYTVKKVYKLKWTYKVVR